MTTFRISLRRRTLLHWMSLLCLVVCDAIQRIILRFQFEIGFFVFFYCLICDRFIHDKRSYKHFSKLSHHLSNQNKATTIVSYLSSNHKVITSRSHSSLNEYIWYKKCNIRIWRIISYSCCNICSKFYCLFLGSRKKKMVSKTLGSYVLLET